MAASWWSTIPSTSAGSEPESQAMAGSYQANTLLDRTLGLLVLVASGMLLAGGCAGQKQQGTRDAAQISAQSVQEDAPPRVTDHLREPGDTPVDISQGTGPDGPLGIIGDPDITLIRQVIAAHRTPITRCYKNGLRVNQALEGRVATQFAIGPSGAVSGAWITESSLKNEEVEACIVEEFLKMTFPAFAGNRSIIINYPINFQFSD